MSRSDRFRAQRAAEELSEPVEEAGNLARKLGLDPYRVNYWVVDHDEMNELIAYGGFQRRYPHWRWGMAYERQRKQGQFLGGKAFEIVNNDDPAHAFLQESNTLADQKAVITHVEAHSDFFANNQWFGLFNPSRSDPEAPRRGPDASAMLARHAETIDGFMSDPEIDRAAVERWIDHLLCVEDVIDQYQAYKPVGSGRDGFDDADLAELADQLDDLDVSADVRRQVFDTEWLEAQSEDGEPASFPEEPESDLLGFLYEHGKQYDEDSERAREMEEWQREIIEIVRREAHYFAPQRMTKVMNEGWACVAPDTPIFTGDGLVSMADVLEDTPDVSDGDESRAVYDSHVIEDHDTVSVRTRRGLELTGSNNHRVRRPDGSWVRLDELSTGVTIEVAGGNDVWPESREPLSWDAPEYTTLEDVAEEAGVSVWTVMRYRRLGRAERTDEIEAALEGYDEGANPTENRSPIRIPEEVTPALGRLVGLMVGDGHVSSAAGQIGFTAGERERAEEVAGLLDEQFGVDATVESAESRWRVYAYSSNLVDLFVELFEFPDGKAAATKRVPPQIRRSPKSVVAEFVRGLFDADGYAGEQGAILSTKSEELSKTVQLLLLNFDFLTRRREQADGCYHVHLTGRSAAEFAEKIGFGYDEKQRALDAYVDDLAWFEEESWTDEIVSIQESTGTVYDISVDETHRYAGAGFVNHNSKWESTMMAGEAFAAADEFILYADHMSKVLGSPGMNPYKLGLEMWTYVENSTNRREVVENLLRVEGITPENFHDAVDFDRVRELLEPDPIVSDVTNHLEDLDAADPRVDGAALDRALTGDIAYERYPWKLLTFEGLAERHYSLVTPQHRGFIERIGRRELDAIGRYMFDDAKYGSVEAAIDDVDYTRGWQRMFEIRESHNDVTFVDEFLTQEFVDENDYFTYEYTRATEQHRVTSTDYEDVKKKLLLQLTNFGNPTITVEDGNYRNRNELLLGHRYNGVALDVEQAKATLERVFELWGRPVTLLTIDKQYDDHDVEVARRREREPEPEEVGKRIRYDGAETTVELVEWGTVEHLAADDVDYDTKPEEWLA